MLQHIASHVSSIQVGVACHRNQSDMLKHNLLDSPSSRGMVRRLKPKISGFTRPAGGGRRVYELRPDRCVICLARHGFVVFRFTR